MQKLTLWTSASVMVPLIRREIAGRYRGSVLGILWSLITPLFLLGIYTFVFGIVFKARWRGQDENATMGEFAVTLFAGLAVFQLFSEVVGRSPGLVLENRNYVKKVVFPLEILSPVALGSAFFHAAVSLLVLIAAIFVVHGKLPWTALFLPLVLLPYSLMILGISWLLSSLGVFFRDIGQMLGTIITALLFTSPVFFPVAALPAWLQPWLFFHPVALPVIETRNILVFGICPDFANLSIYAVVSTLIAVLGFLWFQKTRKGFSDVL